MKDYKLLPWGILNLAGLIITVIGMFGVIELLNFEYAIYVFALGTIVTFASMVAIVRLAQKTNKV